jgi:hypothetical protein
LIFIKSLYLLNSLSAGQPNLCCLQYLQVKTPLIIALPIEDKINNIRINNKIIQENFEIKMITPPTKGKIKIIKSGIMSFQLISCWGNLELSPFLKNRELKRPLPKPQVFP